MQKFAVPAPASAVLDIPAGRIQVITADRDDATVEVRPADASNSRDVKAAEQTTVEYGDDGVLRIDGPSAKKQILGTTGSIEVTLQLPAGSRVEAKAAAADFRGVGQLGDVAFEAARGTVKLDEAQDVRLALTAGDVSVGRLRGDGEISTLKGSLTVTEAVRGKVTLRTEHGDVSVGAARGVSASLDAGTHYGRVRNSLHNAEGASAALHIHASTAYGDITASSL
ncbi:DUF4097 family beta strand repeat-containing protein [Streptomyces sp. NPDC003032]